MKLALIGTGSMPLMQWMLHGKGDDSIINMSALARWLGCSHSSLLERIHTHRFDSTVRHYFNEQRKRKTENIRAVLIPAFFMYFAEVKKIVKFNDI